MEVDEKPIAITLSLGIAQTAHHCALENGYNPHHDSVEKLFQRADQALYSAKQAGRNRTIIFAEK
jgi:PleD family two-component response regulator